MVDTIYDDNGRVIGTQHSGDMRWTCMIYDVRGRVTDVTNRNANLVHTHYYLPGQGPDVTCGGIIAHEAVHANQWSQSGMRYQCRPQRIRIGSRWDQVIRQDSYSNGGAVVVLPPLSAHVHRCLLPEGQAGRERPHFSNTSRCSCLTGSGTRAFHHGHREIRTGRHVLTVWLP
ncbi:MAG: hypothetical protein RLY23_512 [Actinomycetota bacterium]